MDPDLLNQVEILENHYDDDPLYEAIAVPECVLFCLARVRVALD